MFEKNLLNNRESAKKEHIPLPEESEEFVQINIRDLRRENGLEVSDEYELPVCYEGGVSMEEALHARKTALQTLKALGVDMDLFHNKRGGLSARTIDISDFVDLNATSPEGYKTYPRKKLAHPKIPLLILLESNPKTYDANGEVAEHFAFYDWGFGKVLINVREADRAVRNDKDDPSVPVTFALDGVVVEEIIHFVQDAYWGRELKERGGTYGLPDKEHDEHPIEKEANVLKKIILQELYPQHAVLLRSIDYDL